jgi:hypothetical protein
MKRRHKYVLLFAVPALLASAMVAVLVGAAVAGVLWLFVFGDNPWPPSVGTALTVLFVVVALVVWAVLLSVAYAYGRKQEARDFSILWPVVAAAGATAFLVALVVLQQWRVGNLGPKSADMLCSEYCRDKGYAASGMPPRNSGEATCSCLDAQGREAVKVPIDQIARHPSE